MDLETIKGVGDKTIEVLKKLNLITIEDLITYYPYRYNVYRISNLVELIEPITIKGIIDTVPRVNYIKRNLNALRFRLNTNKEIINVTIYNRAFLKNNLTLGREINVIGKYNKKTNTFIASDIKLNKIYDIEIDPVYHLVNGITNKGFNKIINECLKSSLDVTDYIPGYLVGQYEFIDKLEAIKEIHNPSNNIKLKKSRLRLIYEEFFVFMFKVNFLKYKYTLNDSGIVRNVLKDEVNKFIDKLPFKLTKDQLDAVNDIYQDLISKKRMNRLILGDVGSGKTIVSIVAMYINYLSGYQSALMAPTEVLAKQHYINMQELFKDCDVNIGLLSGSMKKSEKNKVLEQLQSGEIDILIGTHALISSNVYFNKLGLVITDEQHRFGVNQRSLLQNKGVLCDVLYMSATPIPRTYALTIYGDMDTSLIKSKPNGRKEIITLVKSEKEIKSVLMKMFEELKLGHQIYIVAPLINDEEEKNELNDIYKLEEKINIAFNNKFSCDILHGKMKNNDKEKVMKDFKDGKTKILISTTVIEVGIDVKNATMMVIFNSERFGLATLHQLRGRVGRNDLQSYCYLICNSDIDRLKVMTESNNGFYISEKDFEMRGQGDLFGIRQSGDMAFKIGDLHRDYKILLQAKKDANTFLENNINDYFSNYKCYKDLLKRIDFID